MTPFNLFRLTARRPISISNISRISITSVRSLHRTALLCADKDTIDTEKSEYSKTGGDGNIAANEEAAFDPENTSPEGEKDATSKGNEESGNPLDVSPANKEVSKPRPTTEGGAENSGEARQPSGGGSPNKGKKVRGS